MSEPYKEPETMRTAHPKEEPSKEPPVLVESHDNPANLPARVNQDPFVGTTLNGRYRVLSLIGKGATSAVYRAEDTKLNETVAIKVLRSHLAEDPVIMRRFEQEAKTAQLLRHPNIVDVRGYEKTDSGNPFLVMDLVEGTSLQDAIKTAGWLPVERTVEIFVQVCAALAAAHEKGIVHRDLKPSNIMLTNAPDGSLFVKVLDFGVAKILPATGDTVLKLTQTGEMLGSILYMSPEQCLDKELDGRSDCYSLGCVMYETLTGKPPLSARTAFETMNKHMTEMPERLDNVRPELNWPSNLQHILFKALSKDPNQRYQNILHLKNDLQNLQTGSAQKPWVQATDSSYDLTDIEELPDQIRNYATEAIAARTREIEVVHVQTVIAIVIFAPCVLATQWIPVVMVLIVLECVLGYFLLVKKAVDKKKMLTEKARALVGKLTPSRVSITSVQQDKSADKDYPDFWVDFELIHSAGRSKKRRIKISPFDSGDPRWTMLSQGAKAIRQFLLPLVAEAYLDSNGDPVALDVKGALAWVLKI
jgi:serine/threonine-protein kinase